MGLCGNFAHSYAERSTVEVSKLCLSHTSTAGTFLTFNASALLGHEPVLWTNHFDWWWNSLISFIRSDGSLPWHCLRSHSIKFLEDLAVIWRRLHHVMRGYKVKSSQIYPRRWWRRRSILSLRLLDQQVTASKANLQVAEPKKFHLQPNIWLKSEVWA